MVHRLCAFCEKHLTQGKNGTRAREHVFKESWIRELKHHNTQIHLDHFRKENLLRSSTRPAIHFLAGDICDECNSGWMNDIDISIEHTLMKLARGELALEAINLVDARNISRWLLKTAATFILADSKDRRHLTRQTLKKVPNPEFLPAGFVAFGFQYQTDYKGLGAATSDTIISIDPGVTKKFSRSERMKFGIQYDRLILGCSFVTCTNPLFIGLPRMHFPLYCASNNLILDEDLWPIFQKASQNTPFEGGQFLNDFLLGLTFWSEAQPQKARLST